MAKVKAQQVKMAETPVNSKGTKHGGWRPGGGRKPGSMTENAKLIRDLAQSLVPGAIMELARIAGLGYETMYDKNNQPIMLPMFDAEGLPIVDEEGNQLYRAKTEKRAGSPSDNARVSAIDKILERAGGKATQPLSNGNPDTPFREIKGIELEEVEPGSPLVTANDNDENVMVEEVAAKKA